MSATGRLLGLISVFILVAISFIEGCGATATSIVNVTDEEFSNSKYKRILVIAPYDDLELRDGVETLFARELSNRPVVAYKGIDVLPPLKEYSYEDISRILNERDIQSVLVVCITDFWTEYYKTPDQTITKTNSKTRSSSTLASWGTLLSINTSSETSGKAVAYTIPGLKFKKSNVRLDVRMFKYELAKPPRMIWRANSTTSGNFFTGESKVLSDAAGKISVNLIAEGLNAPPAAPRIPGFWAVSGSNSDIILGDLYCEDWKQESIFNQYGKYGIKAENTIWDPNGIYASDTSDCSACNIAATNPPKIINQYGEIIGRLSLNPKFEIGYDSKNLKEFLLEHICQKRNTN